MDFDTLDAAFRVPRKNAVLVHCHDAQVCRFGAFLFQQPPLKVHHIFPAYFPVFRKEDAGRPHICVYRSLGALLV